MVIWVILSRLGIVVVVVQRRVVRMQTSRVVEIVIVVKTVPVWIHVCPVIVPGIIIVHRSSGSRGRLA